MVKSKSTPRKRSQKSSKAKKLFIVFSCFFIVVVLLFLFFPPANKLLRKTRLYEYIKTTEDSLIEDDAQRYRNSKANNLLRNFNVKKSEKNDPDKETGNSGNGSAVEYNKKDRDYLNNLIKKNH